MKTKLILLLAMCLGGLVTLILARPEEAQTVFHETFAPQCADSWTPKTSTRYLQKVAESITVKVISGNSNGSGTLIRKYGDNYIILTNHHVLTGGKPYRIQTPDGQIYRAISLPIQDRINEKDLALLTFSSNKKYEVATVAAAVSQPVVDEEVFASGFLFDSKQITLTQGKISHLSEKSFKGGYQIGYSNKIEKGMSGGAILDTKGRVIGIHGRADGDKLYQVQLGYSLGVPVRNFLGASAGIPHELLNVDKSPPPQETEAERELIRNALLPPEKPGSDAKETDWLNYGNQLWRLFDYQDAVEAFDKAIAINSDLAIAYYARGLALRDWGKYQEALASFEQATRKKEEFYEAWREKSRMLAFFLHKDTEALVSINQAIQLNSNDFVLYLLQGDILTRLNRNSDAIKAYNQAIRLNPQPSSYISRGEVRFRMGDKSGAIADFNKAIELNPKSSDAYIYRAHFYYSKLRDVKGGEADFSQAIQLKPDYYQAYYRRGNFRYNWENYQGAVEDYNKVIQNLPYFPPVYYQRGLAYRQLGDKQAAIADFQKAAALYKQQDNQDFHQEAIKRIQEIERNESKVAIYEGEALNNAQKGKISIEITNVDTLSGQVRLRLAFSKGLWCEGELVGTINSNNLVEVSGQISDYEAGGVFDILLRFEILTNQTIQGNYRVYPHEGNTNQAQNAEFNATQVTDNNSSQNSPKPISVQQ